MRLTSSIEDLVVDHPILSGIATGGAAAVACGVDYFGHSDGSPISLAIHASVPVVTGILAGYAAHKANHAERDALTGVYNLRWLKKSIKQVVKKARAKKEEIGFFYFDINYFKKLNDEHGHQRGDGVIQAFARMLESGTRKSDYVVRIGGDEFLIVASKSGRDTKSSTLDRLRQKVTNYNNGANQDIAWKLEFAVGFVQMPYNKPDDWKYSVNAAEQEMKIDKGSAAR